MLEKFFHWTKKKEEAAEPAAAPQVLLGRYSDNNKPVEKVARWNDADTLFKEKSWQQSITAFFDYLRDDETNNVQHIATETSGTFQIYQGSAVIRGYYDAQKLQARVTLARMAQPSVPVMRRLLEMNFTLYYTRYALQGDALTMLFDSPVNTANPSKLYYGLKELATKADKHDDLLLQEFTGLTPVDTEHIEEIPKAEKEIKFRYFKKWITETTGLVNSVDADKYSGGIAYLLLALAYRIDFLIMPEGKLLSALEKIVDIYFRKDERPVAEKNGDMLDEFQKLLGWEEPEFFANLFRSRYTFSIVTPQAYKTIADAIYNANQNIAWYKEARHPEIAAQISEYGIAYCQYSYSLPRPVTELFSLFMMVNYADYFEDLGYKPGYCNQETKEYNREAITAAIEAIVHRWQPKYPEFKIKADKLRFENPLAFNQTFTTEIEYLNLETR